MKDPAAPPGPLLLGNLRVDLQKRTIQGPDTTQRLTTREAQLLAFLLEHRHQDVSRKQLIEEVWGYSEAARTRAVDTMVRKLRKKIEPCPSAPIYLLTVHGYGYRLEIDTAPERSSRSRGEVPYNLVAAAGGFFGRSQLLAEISARFAGGERLVTLVGPPGIGKSRTALEWGINNHAHWVGGVHLCEAENCTEPGHLVSAIEDGLRLSGLASSRGGLAQRLGALLRYRGATLVILDGLENGAKALAPFIREALKYAQPSRLLCTSQIPLGISEESTLVVPPLTSDAAMQLLLKDLDATDRQRASQGHERALNAIITRLGALPLALQLAASRLRLHSPSSLLDSLRGARGPGGDGPGSQDLRDSLEQAVLRLPGPARQTLAALSLFRDSFSLADTAAVASSSEPNPEEALALLVQHSLVSTRRVDDLGDERRFSMLPPLQRHLLARSRGEGWFAQAQERYRCHMSHISVQLAEQAKGSRPASTPELADLRFCLRECLRASDPRAAHFLDAIWTLFRLRGTPQDLDPYLEQARRRCVAPTLLHVQLVEAEQSLLIFDARRSQGLSQSLLTLLGPGDARHSRVLLCAARSAYRLGDGAACQTFSEALIHWGEAHSRPLATALGCISLAILSKKTGDSAAAEGLLSRAADLAQACGAAITEARSRGNLAALLVARGHFYEARAHFERGVLLARANRAHRDMALLLANWGRGEMLQGSIDHACRRLEEGLGLSRLHGNLRGCRTAWLNLSAAYQLCDRPQEAFFYSTQILGHLSAVPQAERIMIYAFAATASACLGRLRGARQLLAVAERVECGKRPLPYRDAFLALARFLVSLVATKLPDAGEMSAPPTLRSQWQEALDMQPEVTQDFHNLDHLVFMQMLADRRTRRFDLPALFT